MRRPCPTVAPSLTEGPHLAGVGVGVAGDPSPAGEEARVERVAAMWPTGMAVGIGAAGMEVEAAACLVAAEQAAAACPPVVAAEQAAAACPPVVAVAAAHSPGPAESTPDLADAP